MGGVELTYTIPHCEVLDRRIKLSLPLINQVILCLVDCLSVRFNWVVLVNRYSFGLLAESTDFIAGSNSVFSALGLDLLISGVSGDPSFFLAKRAIGCSHYEHLLLDLGGTVVVFANLVIFRLFVCH